jgi:hypothetical protein
LLDRVILAAKTEDVHELMNQILARLPGVITEYKSVDTVLDADEVNFPPEFLNSLDSAGLPLHRFYLKWDLQLFYYGTSTCQNFANGTRLCVKKMLGNVIKATIITEKERVKQFLSHGYHSFRRISLLTSRNCNFQ